MHAKGRQRCRPFFVGAQDQASARAASAPHAQAAPAAQPHPQPLGHAQAIAPAFELAAAAAWQPHVQPVAGQFAHRQMVALEEFIAFPFLVCRTRRVRGKRFCGRGPRST